MKRATVVGAGFTGLVTSYFLVKKGWKVEIYEKSRVGGLIGTVKTPNGPVETAANGILCSALLEEICKDIGVELQPMHAKSFKFNLLAKIRYSSRYFYFKKLRRMPLSFFGLLAFLYGFVLGKLTNSLKPNRLENLWDWSFRNFGSEFAERIISIAPNGIYASSPKMLSAHLVVGRHFSKDKALPENIKTSALRGTVSPKNGMAELIHKLESYLQKNGVRFLKKEFELRKPSDEAVIVCTNSQNAAKVVEHLDKDLSARLQKIELLPLVSVTVFFQPMPKQIVGFGTLFGPAEGFHSLGVLFNSDIFSERNAKRSETWILGGDLNREVVDLSEKSILTLVAEDRLKLCGYEQSPLAWHISKWPQAIPKYSLDLERHLPNLKSKVPRLHLNGNYLGSIGLGQIIIQSEKLVLSLTEKP